MADVLGKNSRRETRVKKRKKGSSKPWPNSLPVKALVLNPISLAKARKKSMYKQGVS